MLIIPQHYSRDLLEQHQPHLALITDNTDRSVAGAIGEQMSQLVTSINAPQVPPREPPQALLDVVEVYPYIDYIKYLLPGSVALAIFVTAMIGGGMLFIDDKSRGLHEGYMVTPITKWELILGFNLSGEIKAILAGETVLVLGAMVARVPNFFQPVRLLELTFMVVLTSIALIGMMFFIMARISDPLVPRAIFGVLNTLLFFPSGAVYPIAGFPKWLRVMSECDPFTYAVHAFRTLLLKDVGISAIGTDIFALTLTSAIGAGGLGAAVPPDPVTMPRTASKTAVDAMAAVRSRRPRAVVLQLENLAGSAPAAGSRAGAAADLNSREFWLLAIAGAGNVSQHEMAELCGLDPSSLVAIAGWPGAPRLAAPAAQSARPPCAVGAAHRRRRSLVYARSAARPARRGAAVGGALRGRPASVGGRHAQIDHDFEMTREPMKLFGSIPVFHPSGGRRQRSGTAFSAPAASGTPTGDRLAGFGTQQPGRFGERERAARRRHHDQRQYPEPQRCRFPDLTAAACAAPRPSRFPASSRSPKPCSAAWPITWALSGVTQTVRQNSAQVSIARSALLPNLNGVAQRKRWSRVDLATLRPRISIVPGFRIPTVVGPFNFFDLQASLSQTVANLTGSRQLPLRPCHCPRQPVQSGRRA